MQIAIDARYINDHFPGIGRYVYNLIDALGPQAGTHRLLVLHNPALVNTRHPVAMLARHPAVELIETPLRPFSLAEQRGIPTLLRRLRADLFHAPYYVRPYAGLPCRSVTTLYDAIPRLFPAEVSPRARVLFNLLTRLAARGSQHILAISASARADLIAAYRIPAARITVTPLAASPRFAPQPPERIAAARARHALPERYVICLSSNKPHKNLETLVAAFAQLDAPDVALVLAGHWDQRYPAARDAAERLNLASRVCFLPGIAEDDLPALLSGAAAFAFPSRYEGFGLPPLEALACGAPVVCSNTSSLPEVVGDAGLLVEPNAAAFAAALGRVLNEPALAERLRAAGPLRAAQFSWHATAAATLAAYEQAAR